MPDRKEVIRLLARYRAQELLVLADPGDPEAWNSFESTTYTLCVLMGGANGVGRRAGRRTVCGTPASPSAVPVVPLRRWADRRGSRAPEDARESSNAHHAQGLRYGGGHCVGAQAEPGRAGWGC